MAQSVVLVRPTNSPVISTRHTISASDVTNGGIVIHVNKDNKGSYRFDLVASVTVLSSAGNPVVIGDLTILYTSGAVSIAGTFTQNQVLDILIVAVKDSEVLIA